MSRSLYIYWPTSLMVGTVALACMVDPARVADTLPLSFDGPRALAMLTSPYLIACVVFAFLGIRHARRVWSADESGFSDTDRMATVWFLMNACWYHTGCDIASGLFQVMPNLRDAYAISNAAHHMPMHHPDRVVLDAVYWFEFFVQLPLSVVVYFMYLRRSPVRPVVETFLCGLHLTGTVAYYLPYMLMGETSHPVISNIDRTIACTWIIVPALLTWRAAGQVREMAEARAAVTAAA